jgi:hypothetical protein
LLKNAAIKKMLKNMPEGDEPAGKSKFRLFKDTGKMPKSALGKVASVAGGVIAGATAGYAGSSWATTGVTSLFD